jgi:two-component system OmpR family response regulator
MVDRLGRLLVAEDDEDLGGALCRGLGAEGFDVALARDGVDALALAREHRFDVIVLDLMLPGLNGFCVCEDLRKDGDVTPVLVLTAKQGEWDEAEALETGADDYLKKPFSFVVLVAHLKALLRRRGRPRAASLTAGDLRLDVAAHRCWRGDTEINLTRREFALLELLLEHVGEPITKRQILDEVWDWAVEDASNRVEVYIGYLRRKIDAPFDRRAVQTLRGVGYRLDPEGG